MTSDRRAIRAALVDAGVPIDRADQVAADLADELAAEAPDDTGPARSWLGDALAVGRHRTQSPFRWATPDDDTPPPDAA